MKDIEEKVIKEAKKYKSIDEQLAYLAGAKKGLEVSEEIWNPKK